MKLIESYSAKTSGIPTRYMNFKFDTGHSMQVFSDHTCYRSPNQRFCRSERLQAEMLAASKVKVS